ncbi:hypothetical protein GCM10023216_21960 [Isoptericola chiayiensis]|uniref:Uncharacterized protein n=1 Tax=Isoptericola chiayiensis TaxID=579446 RepID=A0ABP8YGY7_9MICO|nr:hypothetical protein [Isoptericola chiayiensis]NOW00423.1 hypothetical protein [Isoptericola chiayiensis]
MTIKRATVATSALMLMSAAIWAIVTGHVVGGWILSLTLPALVAYGLIRRLLHARRPTPAVRPAVQGMGEVQNMILNRPSVPVTYGSQVETVVVEGDSDIRDSLFEDPGSERKQL